MKSYGAYLFDCDGTLIDTTELIYQCFLFSCKKFGNLEVKREEVFSNIGIPLQNQLLHFLGPVSEEKLSEIIKAHMDYQLKIFKNYLSLFPHVAETLSQFKNKGKKLGVVTSRKTFTLNLYFKHTGILHFFDILITPESTEKHKPDPEPALEALKRLLCSAEETLFIGDSVYDMECGERAGMDTAFVTWSKIDPDSLSTTPTYFIDEMKELLITE